MPFPASRFSTLQLAGSFAALLFISVVPLVSAQKLPLEAPLEREEDGPNYVWRNGISPAMVSQQGGFVSRQVNVSSSGNNITGDAANEPSICVDPTNPDKMAIGWRQFDSVASNFREGGWGYTADGGDTWTFPAVLENNVFRSDPVLNSDRTGGFFYLSLVSNFFDDMWRSLDSGGSWIRLGPATGGDKQWSVIDTTTSTGQGFQYQSWSTAGNNYGGRQFSRSTDGGVTWMDPIFIPNRPSWGTLDVDANGNLFIGGINQNTGQVWCVRSTDAKNGAVTPTFDRSTPVNLGGSIAVSQPINPVGLVGQITIAADRSGASTNNNIYMLASVQPSNGSARSDVMFVRSTDGGQTFSAPRRINDDTPNVNKWHWFGTMAVAPNGRIDVLWLDTRNAANHTDSQLFYSYSTDGGVTWSANVAVSQPFNPFLGYPNQSKMGDYMQIVSDNNGGHVAYCATFNGEQDIYYVRVGPHVPTPSSAVSRKTHGSSGTFDIILPLTGNSGVECRLGSGANFDAHQMVVTFPVPVTLAGVTVTSANSLATSTHSVAGGVVTINLSAVADQQTVTVTLLGVDDGAGIADVAIRMGVLIGDTNGNRVVSASDLGETKARSGQAVTSTNFRTDVTASGDINAGDIGVVKARSGGLLSP